MIFSKISLTFAFIFIVVLLSPQRTNAISKLEQYQTGRGSQLPVYEMIRPDALATLVLLPGANAHTGPIKDGIPTSQNFLVRSKDLFYNQGFNVLIVFKASDQPVLGYADRLKAPHQDDLTIVLSYARKKLGKPVWLVGTS